MKYLHYYPEKRSNRFLTYRYLLVVLIVFFSYSESKAQTMMPLPNFNNTYSGYVRGYWFTAPTSFIITGVRVPSDAGTGTQNIQIIKINDPTPVAWSSNSTNFTTLEYIQGAPNNVIQNVNIMVNQGDIIGVLGQAGTTNSYSVTGGPYASTILGQSLTLHRLIYQGNITSSPAPNYSWEQGSSPIGRVELYYNSPTPCSGAPTGGVANAPALTCGSFGLSLSGSTSAANISYQWLSSSSANGPWVAIPGATSPNETLTQSTGTYYACEVTCDNSNLSDTSTAVFVQSPPMIAPYFEGFDNGSLPQCWESLSNNPSTSTNNYWKFTGAPGYGATNNGRASGTYAWADGSSITPDSMMLITPEIDISQLTSPYLSFEWFSNNTNNPGDNVPLIVEVFDGSTWSLLDTLMGDDSEWQFTNYDLSSYQGSIIQVRFMVNQTFPNSLAQYNDILIDEVIIDNCISLGGVDGSVDVCKFEGMLDLNNGIITKPNGGGIWSYPNEPAFLTQDSIFNFEFLTPGTYEVYYVERAVCYDTTTATINVFDESKAGEDGTVEVCMNQPINLIGILSGQIDLGGDWYDYSGSLLPNTQPTASNIPGTYNYTYVADNGVCPADTSIAEVVVRSDCDYLSIEGEMFTELSVYPNPATSQLHIVNPSNTSDLKIEMLDMNGRVVLVENQALSNATKATLSIHELENGVYTLRVYNNEGFKTFKVVKQ